MPISPVRPLLVRNVVTSLGICILHNSSYYSATRADLSVGPTMLDVDKVDDDCDDSGDDDAGW